MTEAATTPQEIHDIALAIQEVNRSGRWTGAVFAVCRTLRDALDDLLDDDDIKQTAVEKLDEFLAKLDAYSQKHDAA